jgi:hypothetical protein
MAFPPGLKITAGSSGKWLGKSAKGGMYQEIVFLCSRFGISCGTSRLATTKPILDLVEPKIILANGL